MNEQVLSMQITRQGYGVHPDRDIVIIDNSRFFDGDLRESLAEAAARYGEADFIIFREMKEELYEEEDNLYYLPSLTDEQLQFLKSRAKLEFYEESSVTPEEFTALIEKGLEKEGYNRKGTTSTAFEHSEG